MNERERTAKPSRLAALCLAFLWSFSATAQVSYEFTGEGEALLEVMQEPPRGTDYCSPRLHINEQLVIYSFARKPGEAGLARGDRILAVNGVSVEGLVALTEAMGALGSKDKYKILVDRNGKPVEVTRECSDDTEIDKTLLSLAEAIVAENWDECRKLVKPVEKHEKLSNWINIRMRCNYLQAASKGSLQVYWNRDWPLDLYQYNRLALLEASYGSVDAFEALRPSVIQAISDLRRNGQRMYSGDLSNDFNRAAREVQIRNGLLDPEAEAP